MSEAGINLQLGAIRATARIELDPTAAADLPRQPHAGGLDATDLRQRAEQFNEAFWTLLTTPARTLAPELGDGRDPDIPGVQEAGARSRAAPEAAEESWLGSAAIHSPRSARA